MFLRNTLTILALLVFTGSVHASIVIVQESFGGDGTGNLNATTLDTFDSAIVSAGGSDTWRAATKETSPGVFVWAFDDNGSVYGNHTMTDNNNSAAVNLGSYIDDAKGTSSGYFELTATISETTGSWLSLGFSTLTNPAVLQTSGSPQNFTSNGTEGIATMIYRASGEIAAFAGPLTADGSGNTAAQSGARTFTIALDLTTHNGVDDFGSVVFSDSALGVIDSHSYTSDQDFGSILLSTANGSTGSYSSLSLTQVPEPASLALVGIGGLLIAARRRTVA